MITHMYKVFKKTPKTKSSTEARLVMLRCRGSLLNASGDLSACVPCSASGVHIVLILVQVVCAFCTHVHVLCMCTPCGACGVHFVLILVHVLSILYTVVEVMCAFCIHFGACLVHVYTL